MIKSFIGNLKMQNKVKKNTANRKGLISYNNNNLGENNSLNGDSEYVQKFTNYPNNLLYFDCEKKYVHPTQKPLELIKYLVLTYSNEGDLVLDSCMGSGTTGVACKELNRNFIGIEIDSKYFEIAKERVNI
jgi:site-specific DNA-methyltransferase (adenine-specific)